MQILLKWMMVINKIRLVSGKVLKKKLRFKKYELKSCTHINPFQSIDIETFLSEHHFKMNRIKIFRLWLARVAISVCINSYEQLKLNKKCLGKCLKTVHFVAETKNKIENSTKISRNGVSIFSKFKLILNFYRCIQCII